MVLTRKGISASSEAIIKEQRQITREKLLASPGLIIGTIGFLLILVTAILVPDPQHTGSQCDGGQGSSESTKCCTYFWNR